MFKKIVLYTIIVTHLAATVSVAYADGIRDAAQMAVGDAQAFINSSQMPTYDNGIITLPGGETVKTRDLFPGTSSQNTESAGTFMPAGYNTDTADIESIYGDDSRAHSEGGDTKSLLFSDSRNANASTHGVAYSVLQDSANISRPNLSNDPVFAASKDIYNNTDAIIDNFTDCSSTPTLQRVNRPIHMPDLKHCNRVSDYMGTASIIHDYYVSLISHNSGPANIESCGVGCIDLWIGQVGNNYWKGDCRIYEQSMTVRIDNPDAITNVVIDRAVYDDHMQIYIGGTKVFNGPTANFPPETAGKCELKTSWNQSPQTNITSYFKNVAPGTVLQFKIRVSVSGEGEGYAALKLNYDPKKVITDNGWEDDPSIEAALAIKDRFADGTLTCNNQPILTNGCATFNGIQACENDFLDSGPLAGTGISPFCRKVEVEVTNMFNMGEMDCFIDVYGDTQCLVNEGGNNNTCQQYEDDSQCGFISSTCVEGALGFSGNCYNNKEVWDCGTNQIVEDAISGNDIQCDGPMRCMGLECFSPDFNQSSSFSKAAALLEVASMAGNDMECNEDTIEDNRVCSVFEGKGGYCKIAVGGTQDCCESPDGVSLADYLTLMKSAQRADAAFSNADIANKAMNNVQSFYKTASGTIKDAVSSITEPFTTAIDSAIAQLKDTLKDAVGDQFKSWMKDTFTKDAVNSAAGSAGSGLIGGAEVAGQLMSAVGTVFMYYQMAVLLIQVIYKCEEEEIQLTVDRELKQCHYVGSYCNSKLLGSCVEERESYCCFSSPLSRIIHEQVRPQLRMSWGTPKNPFCGGLSVEQLGLIDWAQVNLDEWVGMLNMAELYPSPTNINIDRRTGVGSLMDYDDTRYNAIDRTLERMGGLEGDALRRKAQDYTPAFD